jgi:hypothetical protein
MKEEEIRKIIRNLESASTTLKTIGYETLFMIKDYESGITKEDSEARDCLIRINNLAQKASKKIENQTSSISYFLSKE